VAALGRGADRFAVEVRGLGDPQRGGDQGVALGGEGAVRGPGAVEGAGQVHGPLGGFGWGAVRAGVGLPDVQGPPGVPGRQPGQGGHQSGLGGGEGLDGGVVDRGGGGVDLAAGQLPGAPRLGGDR
jgi:hypothetical protein